MLRTKFSELATRYPLILAPIKASYLSAVHKYRSVRNSPAEAVLDNLSKSIVDDICIDVDEFRGKFFVDARSALFRRIARDGYYEPALTKLCSEHIQPEGDVLDIGANIGFHSVFFAKTVTTGRVLAIEPTSHAHRRLVRNLELNNVSNKVDVHHGAVSDLAGTASIKVIQGREEFSTLGKMAHQAVQGETWMEELISCDTVDALVLRYNIKPRFIKLDVEGFEHRVLQGATDTLKQYRPIILAELSNALLSKNGSSASAVIEWLTHSGYRVSNANDISGVPGTSEYGEIVCVPE